MHSKRKRYRDALGVFATFGVFLSQSAFSAQAPDAGETARELQRPALPAPKKDRPDLEVEQPARPPLKATEGVKIRVSGFLISGNRAFPEAELHTLIRDAIGKELTLAELQDVVERISRFYRERGYPLARAYLPAQDIRDGVVEIAVLEGRYDRIRLNNRSAVQDGVLAAPLTALKSGAPIEGNKLERGLLLLSDTPGIEVKSTLKPGAAVGTSDLVVDVEPGRRVTGAVDLDNFGNRYTGEYRLGGSVNLNNPLGRGDVVTLRGIVSDEDLSYGRIGYQLPVGTFGTRVGASYSDMRYQLGKDFTVLNAHGSAEVASVFLSHPFVRSRNLNLTGSVSYDDKSLRDLVDSTSTATDKSANDWTFSLVLDRRDGLGGGGVTGVSLAYTEGNLSIDSADAKVTDDATARTHGHFGKWNLTLQRLQALSEKWSLYGSLQSQWASKNLDSSEKLTLGGAYGVRAYPQGEASGDEGYIANLELRYAPTTAWQFAGFLDSGHVTINESPWTTGTNGRTLRGYGFLIAWNKPETWQVKATLAWRDTDTPTSDVDRSPRGWVQVVRRF